MAGHGRREWVTPYPPGIPAVGAGEVHNETAIEYLEEVVARPAGSWGASDQSLDKLRVLV